MNFNFANIGSVYTRMIPFKNLSSYVTAINGTLVISPLPEGLELVSGVPEIQGTFDVTTKTWSLGEVPPNTTLYLELKVKLTSLSLPKVVEWQVFSNGIETDSSNNTGSWTINPDTWEATNNYLPEPEIFINTENAAGNGMLGEVYTLDNSLLCRVNNVPNSFMNNEDLDVRLELLRFVNTKKKGKPRTKGFVHPDQFVDQINENADGRRTGGGSHSYSGSVNTVNLGVRTEWPLFGRVETEHIDLSPSLFRWWKNLGTTTKDDFFQVTPGFTGHRTYRKRNKETKPYGGSRLEGYFCFRYSMRDIYGDGTKGDRIIGPTSKVIRMAVNPWPIYTDDITDEVKVRENNNNFTLTFAR